MTTATKVACLDCGKEVKERGLAAHKRLAHPAPVVKTEPTDEYILEAARSLDMSEHPMFKEIREGIEKLQAENAELTEQLEKVKQLGKSVEDIARVIYDDVARGICDSHGISLKGWEEIDHNDYLKVARKIKG